MQSQTAISSTAGNATLFARLADRWCGAGIHLAAAGRDGVVQWHDAHMPAPLALFFTIDPLLQLFLRALPAEPPAGFFTQTTLCRGVTLGALSLQRRKRKQGWLLLAARTSDVTPGEELQRLASRGQIDATTAAHALQQLPRVDIAALPSIAAIVGQMHDDLANTATTTQELSSVTQQLSSMYEEVSLLFKVSTAMQISDKPEAFLGTVCQDLQDIARIRAVAIATVPDDETTGSGMPHLAPSAASGDMTCAELLTALRQPIERAFASGETVICNDASTDPAAADFPATLQRFAILPLIRDKRALGVLLAADKIDHAEFSSVDLKLLSNVGNQCSIFLENAGLYRDMQALFMGVLHALTRSIDAKDPYTRGHSQRVADFSRALARKIGLSDAECERVYLSGLLHDVGKIGVPESVLCKPGKLTDDEFAAIKKHPEIGAQILGNIRQLADIIPGVLYHHEKWDGRGYPHRLAGTDIPLIARIICVADSFDAMSSTRTYRAAMSLDTVLAEVARCGGTHFDPELAAAFVTIDVAQYMDKTDLAAPSEPAGENTRIAAPANPVTA
jgi:HD-GYP domain-containing protein (c-di-GMP phosphodiesterase class II)